MTTSTLDNLYTQNPGTKNVETTPSAVAGQATGTLSQAKDYEAKTQDVPTGNLASSQLNDITSQDSPLIQRARNEGILLAARRGLQNSSLAAGAAEGAMVDRATPIAQQNAAQLQEQSLANQTATNTERQFDAGQETQNNEFNAAEANKTSALNATNTTDVNKQNAQTTAINAQQNAAASNTMTSQTLQANADLNKQFLAGTQAMDLATIQGRYQQLISANDTAANLYQAYFNGISQVMANKDIPPERIAQMVNVQQTMLEAGLRMMDQMNTLDLGDIQLPGATSTPTGELAPTAPGTTQPTSPTVTTQPVPKNGDKKDGKIYINGKWVSLAALYNL